MSTAGPRIELLCVGSELLGGKVNTHVAYLAGALRSIGLGLTRESSLPDKTDEIAGAVAEALSRSDAVFVLGGLGPTFDDLTREGVAAALSRKLRFSPDLMSEIRSKFRSRGLPMAPSNRRQAFLVEGARALRNARGSAPGQILRIDSGGRHKLLALLPGPLQELRPMLQERVLPALRAAWGGRRSATLYLRLCGTLESEVDRRIGPVLARHPEVSFTILAAEGLVDLHALAERRVASLAGVRRQLLSRVGRWAYAEGETALEAVLGEELRRRGQTLAVAESLTGGLLGSLLTDVPGSSDYFLGGVAAYGNESKSDLLGVRPSTLKGQGAVSRACALEMAEGARRRFGADWGVALTGIAGPAGGSARKPVGLTYLAATGPSRTAAEERIFSGDRSSVKARAARAALTLLWKSLGRPFRNP